MIRRSGDAGAAEDNASRRMTVLPWHCSNHLDQVAGEDDAFALSAALLLHIGVSSDRAAIRCLCEPTRESE